MDDTRPIFLQIAEQLENEILGGILPEGSRIPSTNELAAFHRINPATALKGVGMLVDDRIVEKRRGVGMFVAAGARDRLVARRRTSFVRDYLTPLIAEASKLGIDTDELARMLREQSRERGPASPHDETTERIPS